MTPSGTSVLVAGELRLDPVDERLWRGDQVLPLRGKAFALLLALMRRPQQLVTKDDLFDVVWPGLAVSESVLTTAVKELRQALGDDARRPTFIETVHRRGYRFRLPVDAAAPDPGPATAPVPAAGRPAGWNWRRWGVAAAIVLMVLAAIALTRMSGPAQGVASAIMHPKTVAVAAFADLSPSGKWTWFAAGLTQEILDRLTRTPDLRVAASVSGGDAMAAAREGGVAHLLKGSVRHEGERLRVTAELVRTADGVQLWSQSYDRPKSGMISIQEDIAFEIASALKTVMEPERLRAMVGAGTRSVEAYEAYLQGVAAGEAQSGDGDQALSRVAAAAFERARTIDPGFAEAHWQAAETWFGDATRIGDSVQGKGLPERVALQRFHERVDAAIASSKTESQQLKYRSARAVMQLRFREAHRLMVAYLRAHPRDLDAWEEMGDLAAYAGERGWMVRAAERLHTLSMENRNPLSRAVTLSVMALRPEEAARRADEQLGLRPDSTSLHYQAHRAYLWAGRVNDARRMLARLATSKYASDDKGMAFLRQACVDNRLDDARRLYAHLSGSPDLSVRWQVAQIMGAEEVASSILKPLDTPERLPTLMQFLIYPTFDPTPYQALNAALIRNGVARPRAVPMRIACRVAR